MCTQCHRKIINTIIEQEQLDVCADEEDWKDHYFYFSPAEECSSIQLIRFSDGTKCPDPTPDSSLYFFIEGEYSSEEYLCIWSVPKSLVCKADSSCHNDLEHKEIEYYKNGRFLKRARQERRAQARSNIMKKVNALINDILDNDDIKILVQNRD